MANVFYIKRNDTSPAISGVCKDANGDAVNLAGASVAFHMHDPDTGTVIVDGGAGVVVDEAGGEVSYSWAALDTATAGRFKAEFEITYSDTTVETFPNHGYITVVIGEDIG